jgi:hypothetical protein
MTVDAMNREEAVSKFKAMMSEGAIKAHMAEKHPGQPVPTVEQSHAQLEQMVKLAV